MMYEYISTSPPTSPKLSTLRKTIKDSSKKIVKATTKIEPKEAKELREAAKIRMKIASQAFSLKEEVRERCTNAREEYR